MKNNIENTQKYTSADKLTFISGVAVSFILTATARLLSVLLTNMAGNTIYEGSALYDTLSYIILIFDSLIFAAGAALILYYCLKKSKRYILLSFAFVLLILTVDLSVAFIIDLLSSVLDSVQIPLAILNISLNIIARLISYSVITAFVLMIIARKGIGDEIIPLISSSHPICRSLFIVMLIRMLPYLLFEIYSNINGIVQYGWDMTGIEVLAIISAYVEIIIDGIIVYFAGYLFILLYKLFDKHFHKA